MRLKIITLLFLILPLLKTQAQHILKGKVIDNKNLPIPGATVLIKDTNISTSTDNIGFFSLITNETEVRLSVYAMGYVRAELQVTLPLSKDLQIVLDSSIEDLPDVVVSTGYQSLSNEEITGSYVQIPNDLLNRRVSTNILNRLEDLVPGLTINRDGIGSSHQSQISIRGQNTISGKPDPLIVIDNFPYDGGMENINPNDVESITVLKDAAAASIWGAKAGNGVIVINTKKGIRNREAKVDIHSSLKIGMKPDLFYSPKMSISDYIDMEIALFGHGYFSLAEKSLNHAPLSPVIETLISERDGNISRDEMVNYINSIKKSDIRSDLNKHFYRSSVDKQYQINLSGGGEKQQYYLSGGYDQNIGNVRGTDFGRITLNANNTYFLSKGNLQISPGISYIENWGNSAGVPIHEIIQKTSNSSIAYPYAQLTDEDGNALPLIKDYRKSFIDEAESQGFLDWEYRPLDDIKFINKRNKVNDLRLNMAVNYKILEGFNVDLLYQYQNNQLKKLDLFSLESYYVRDMINKFAQRKNDGSLDFPLPKGAILDRSNSFMVGHNSRLQLNYQKQWDAIKLNTIGGYEIKDLNTNNTQLRVYGYDEIHATNVLVDYINPYPYSFSSFGTGYIPNTNSERDLSDRFLSYYTNTSLSYLNRYILTGSVRYDQSNLFGVKANKRGVPLWSLGLSWNVLNDFSIKPEWISYLRLRSSYGVSGNINRTVAAYPTAGYNNGSFSDTKLPYAIIGNPPNPHLKWEQVRMLNLGLDFSFAKNILNGTIDYFNKRGTDIIGAIPKASSSGVSVYTGNFSDIKGHGVDLSLTSNNLNGPFGWRTNFQYGYVKDIVTDYKADASIAQYLQYGHTSTFAIEGRPLHAIYSYAWAGLDPADGAPLGYLNNEISRDYTRIIGTATLNDLVFNGSSRPTSFGSMRNDFSYGGFSLSANISYRLGYYFRKETVRFQEVLSNGWAHGDYGLRWQKPGDELNTMIPSSPNYGEANISNRDNFFVYSEALVEKGDHFRLQDIKISYLINKLKFATMPFGQVQVYLYADNLAILWKSTDKDIDPDFRYEKPIRTLAFGISINL